MSNYHLLVESWRDFFRAQVRGARPNDGARMRSPEEKFNEKHDQFFYKKALWGSRSAEQKYSKPKLVSEQEMIKIITNPRNDTHIIVRPVSLTKFGEFYDWRKFKFLNSKVEEIIKQREEEKRKEQERRQAQSKKQMDRVETDSELALAVITMDGVDSLVLYHTKIMESDGLPLVIGMIAVDDMYGPCIPNTFQVKFSAVARKFQRQGFGSILYRLAAAHAKVKQNGGISSDHAVGTSKDATRRWDAIDSDPEFYKRSTKAGSDTFDYGGNSTPNDPEDDCEDFTNNGAATNHSYGVGDKTVGVYNSLIYADESGEGYGPRGSTDLNDKATRVFSNSYAHRTRE